MLRIIDRCPFIALLLDGVRIALLMNYLSCIVILRDGDLEIVSVANRIVLRHLLLRRKGLYRESVCLRASKVILALGALNVVIGCMAPFRNFSQTLEFALLGLS